MALFKSKKGGEERTPPAPAAQSVEAMRKRAKHRLIGASILVLLGIVGFPVLFDNQPRPVALDIAIEIPDKNKAKPLVNVPAPAPVASASHGAVIDERAVPTANPVAPVPEKVAAKTISKPVEKPIEKPVEKPVVKVDAGAKAQALLDGKEPPETSALTGRFVVQIGAFADVIKAREVRLKVEKAGLKTYTQVVQPKEGKRIRVRVGPFESKADAEKAAEKIKKLDLPASILEL